MKSNLKLIFILFFTALVIECVAADEKIKVGRNISLPGIGFQFRSLKDCQRQPLPTPSIYQGVRRNGTRVEVMPDPQKFWLRDQCELYLTGGGASIYVAIPKLSAFSKMDLPPLGKDKTSVLKSDYDCWLKNSKKPANDDLISWFELFTGEAVGEKTEIKLNSAASGMRAYSIALKECSAKRLFFFSIPDFPELGVALLYVLDNTPDDMERTEQVLLHSVRSARYHAPRKKKNTPDENIQGSGKYSEKYEENRRRIIADVKNLPDWWWQESDDYIFVSNLKKRKEIEGTREVAEFARKVYAFLLPELKPFDNVSVIRIFEKREDYLQYIEGGTEWSIGVWMADKNEVVVSPLPRRAKKSDRAQHMMQTLYHELLHQYLYYVLDCQHASVWFNEGMAQLMEDIKKKRDMKKLQIQPENSMMEMAEKILATKYAEVQNFIYLNYEEFYEDGVRQFTYPAAHMLMYFLVCGAPSMKEERYKEYEKIPGIYYQTLFETRNIQQANSAAWKGIDLPQFNKDFRKFWESKNDFKRSRNFQLKPLLHVNAEDKKD